MDAFARGLRNAVHIIEDGIIASMMQVCVQLLECKGYVNNINRKMQVMCNVKQERYSSFSHDLGQKVENGTATLEEMEVRLSLSLYLNWSLYL